MSTIELGEIPTADGEPPAPAGSARLGRRLVRQLAAGAAVVLCAVALAGSEVPRSHGLRPLWSVPIVESQGTTLTSDRIFVHRSTADTTSITAYELATGAVRWQRSFAGASDYLQPAEQAGLLLIPTQRQLLTLPTAGDGATFQAEVHEKTIAVSMTTGAEVWRTDGEPYTVGRDSALLTQYTAQGALSRMRVIRLSDRGTVWSHDTPGVRSQVTIPLTGGLDPDKIVTATESGEIKVYAYGTGQLVSSARIPWVKSRPGDGYFNDLSGTGDILVVNRSQAEVFDMSVYRLDTMAELWRASDTEGYAFPCGDSLCLNNGHGVVAYDALTGARRWAVDDAANAWEVTRDRVVVGEGTEDGRMQLIDTATGGAVGEPALGNLASNDENTSLAVVLRPTRSPAGRTAVSRWDLRTGRQWLLGTVAPVAGLPCTAKPGFLACIRGDRYEITAIG